MQADGRALGPGPASSRRECGVACVVRVELLGEQASTMQQTGRAVARQIRDGQGRSGEHEPSKSLAGSRTGCGEQRRQQHKRVALGGWRRNVRPSPPLRGLLPTRRLQSRLVRAAMAGEEEGLPLGPRLGPARLARAGGAMRSRGKVARGAKAQSTKDILQIEYPWP